MKIKLLKDNFYYIELKIHKKIMMINNWKKVMSYFHKFKIKVLIVTLKSSKDHIQI